MSANTVSTRPAPTRRAGYRSRMVGGTLAGIAGLAGAVALTVAPSFASASGLPIANPTVPPTTAPPADPDLPIANPTVPPITAPPITVEPFDFEANFPTTVPGDDPVDPTDPAEPVDPAEPIDPAEPADPADPAQDVAPIAATPAAPAAPVGQLPQTGAETGIVALVGIAFTAAGATVVAVTRRRTA